MTSNSSLTALYRWKTCTEFGFVGWFPQYKLRCESVSDAATVRVRKRWSWGKGSCLGALIPQPYTEENFVAVIAGLKFSLSQQDTCPNICWQAGDPKWNTILYDLFTAVYVLVLIHLCFRPGATWGTLGGEPSWKTRFQSSTFPLMILDEIFHPQGFLFSPASDEHCETTANLQPGYELPGVSSNRAQHSFRDPVGWLGFQRGSVHLVSHAFGNWSCVQGWI